MKKTNSFSLVIYALVFFFLMLLDAHLTRLFGIWDKGNNLWQSQLLLLTMVFASFRFSKRYMIGVSLIIGSLFDLYYISLIGVYAVALPFVVWTLYLFHEYYFQNIVTLFFSWIISLTMVQFIVLGIQLLFQLNVFRMEPFIVHSFGPTLLVNLFFFLLFLFPLKKLFQVNIPFFLKK